MESETANLGGMDRNVHFLRFTEVVLDPHNSHQFFEGDIPFEIQTLNLGPMGLPSCVVVHR